MLSSIRLRKAVNVIHRGGVIAYPTEAVYGLGCDPDCQGAVQYLIDLKRRDPRAGFILIASDMSQLEQWACPGDIELQRMQKSLAQPLTWIVPAARRCPDWITGGRSTIAIRITRHPVAASLCAAVGMPLVSTSANRRGRSPARTALGVRRRFGAAIDLVVSGETGHLSAPTEIRDAATGAILRSIT